MRGQTHIIVRKLQYVTGDRVPKDYRFRVMVTKCTVYKFEDILGDIQTWQPESKVSQNEICSSVRQTIEEMMHKSGPNSPKQIPIMDLTFGPGISPTVNASKQISFY